MTDASEPDAPACDPEMPSALSPVPHDYESGGEESGSLAEGGSYDRMRCRVCHRVAFAPMPATEWST